MDLMTELRDLNEALGRPVQKYDEKGKLNLGHIFIDDVRGEGIYFYSVIGNNGECIGLNMSPFGLKEAMLFIHGLYIGKNLYRLSLSKGWLDF